MHQSSDSQPASGTGNLLSLGFLGLLAAQFFGAMNDNIFRWLVIGIGKQFVKEGGESFVLMEGTVCFLLPYLVFGVVAGWLSDRFNKRMVVISCKFAEMIIVGLGALAILAQRIEPLVLSLFFLGAQAALYAPAKSGSIPEMLQAKYISAANGLFGLMSMIAIVLGTAIGNLLSDYTKPGGMEHWWVSASVLVGVGAVGWAASLFVTRGRSGDPKKPFPWSAPRQMWRDLTTLYSTGALFRVAIGLTFFWSIAAITQLNIDQFVQDNVGEDVQSPVVPLLLSLVLGVALGSVAAGFISRGKVELGLLPIGAGGVMLCSFFLYLDQGDLLQNVRHVGEQIYYDYTPVYYTACVLLAGLGVSAGFFQVPLEAFMQHRSPPASRGSILAATNTLAFGGALLISVVFAAVREPVGDAEHLHPLLSASQVFLLTALITVPIFVASVMAVPQILIRTIVKCIGMLLYRIRIFGRENLPKQGGALLVANHISWLDGFLLMWASPRPVRLLAWAGNFQSRPLKWLADKFGVIMLKPNPKSLVAAIREAREAVKRGEIVAIFPEGGISRTGQVQGFRAGMMKILDGTDAPIIPAYFDELWGSIFSFAEGKFFWKWPRRWRYPISIHIGAPLPADTDLERIRQAVQELSAEAIDKRAIPMLPVTRAFIRRAKHRKFTPKVFDSTGGKLTGGELLLRALILRRLLRRGVLAAGETHVGVLLPPAVGGVVTNTALALDRRVAVNLNYTVSSEVMNECIAVAGIKHVLTSRRFLEKMNFELNAELVFLEDFKDKPTLLDKAICGAYAYALPARMLEWGLGLHRIRTDDVLTVIFTSGSTGTPKGVMLTHGNIASNVEAIDQMIHLTSQDGLLGILPFFHSFGFTVCLWAVMSLDVSGAYHFSPLDGRQVGKLCHQHKLTVLLATPTFLRTYVRRCEKEELATVDVVITGAEKLPADLANSFEEKFGVRPVEGYGTTELSPLVSVNVPKSRAKDNFQTVAKEGSVGRAVPGVVARVVSLETGETLGAEKSGMLQIKGPNVMLGYMGRPDLTAECIRDGWYITGDVAFIDDEGFIHITGRESRFSKIGGEMVPHIKVEEAINQILGVSDDGSLRAAVTAVPDEKKGERLVVLHTPFDLAPADICKALADEGLPNLFIPSPDAFYEVSALPILGTGKLDLKGIRQTAKEKAGTA